MSEVPKFVEIEERIDERTMVLLSSINFNPKRWDHLAPVLISLGVAETIASVCLLGKTGFSSQAHTLMRSALEQFIHLKLVCMDSRNIDDLLLRECSDWIKTMKRGKDGNPFFSKIGEHEEIEELIAKKEEEAQKLIDNGANKNQSIKDRFIAAGAPDLYEGLYHKLSDDAHGSLAALKKRYVTLDGGTLRVEAFHNAGEEQMDALRLSAHEVLGFVEELMSNKFLLESSKS